MTSAPAERAFFAFFAVLIPPPTMIGVSTDCLTAAIISGETGFIAPEPASR